MKPSLFEKLPAGVVARPINASSGFLYIPIAQLSATKPLALQVNCTKNAVALERHINYWMGPSYDHCMTNPEGQVLYYLCRQSNGSYGLLLPLIAGNAHAFLRMDGKPGSLALHLNNSGFLKKLTVCRLSITRPDAIRTHSPTVPWRIYLLLWGHSGCAKEKSVPAFADLFGWCTWDAFYREVSTAKVMQGLATFKRKGFVPRFLILDDGWQDEKKNFLQSF